MSREIFRLPDVGEGLIEADVVEWKVAEGDVVSLNQPLVDIETAKATVELPSPFAGRVVILHGGVGDTMTVGEPLVTIEVGESDLRVHESDAHEGVNERREPVLIGYGVSNEDAVPARRSRRVVASTDTPPTPPSPAASVHEPARTTPPVRLLAKQYGIDLASVVATGRDGLITRDDVERVRSVVTFDFAFLRAHRSRARRRRHAS